MPKVYGLMKWERGGFPRVALPKVPLSPNSVITKRKRNLAKYNNRCDIRCSLSVPLITDTYTFYCTMHQLSCERNTGNGLTLNHGEIM